MSPLDRLKALAAEMKAQGAEPAELIKALTETAIDIAWQERLAGAGFLQEASIAFARAAGSIRATSASY